MEFFEKAHIVKLKNRNTTKNVKKQLKQMLYGYKISDNKLIQSSVDIKNDFDDVTSVSEFSDLNLNNSSPEDDTHADTIHTESTVNEENSLTDVSENLSLSNIYSGNNQKDEEDSDEDSISECNEKIESLSDNLSDEDVSGSESETSIVTIESSSVSEKSDVFDADGNLASKILQNLKLVNVEEQRHKRKYSEVDNDDFSKQKGSIVKLKSENEHETKQKVLQTSKEDSVSSVSSICDDEIENSDDFESNPMSPPFVSITATDMPSQRLDDIIGEYKYSTMRNLPSDNQNIIFSSTSGIFIEENMSVDIQTEDEVCSLIPEVDDVPTAEEIDAELANIDITVNTHVDESVNNLDSTLVSEAELFVEEYYINVEETFKFYYTQNYCIVTMKHPSELFIQGKVKIRALGGTLEVYGYTLKDDMYDIYAPYYSFPQSVKTVANPNVYYGLFGKLTSVGLTVAEAEKIVTTIGDQDGVIILQSLNQKAMDFVDNNFKANHLFVKPNRIIEPYLKRASDVLDCFLFSINSANSWKSFEVHPCWKEANEHAQNKQSRGIVCGGKGVGKSTYLRYQVNKLLVNGPVLVVDLDPGQCEFTVPGNISATVVTTPLLGPSFTHMRNPDIMLNIGMIDTMNNMKRYVSAVQSLITQCFNNEAWSNMPWIINTMGMTNVIGLKFITLTIIFSMPTFLLQYESKNNKKRFETFLRPQSIKLLYEDYKKDHLFINTSCPNDLNYSFVLANDSEKSMKRSFSLRPKEERYLKFLTYFSQLINIHNNLLEIVPYEVHLKNLYIGTNVIVKEDCVTKVINGKVVALCQHARQCDSASAKVFTLSDKALRCHGHGLIRGIDWEKEILYVITPVPSNELGSVDTLLYADWVPELIGQENHLPKGTVVPYRTITQDQHKQLMSTPRRRFNPLQLIKMARIS